MWQKDFPLPAPGMIASLVSTSPILAVSAAAIHTSQFKYSQIVFHWNSQENIQLVYAYKKCQKGNILLVILKKTQIQWQPWNKVLWVTSTKWVYKCTYMDGAEGIQCILHFSLSKYFHLEIKIWKFSHKYFCHVLNNAILHLLLYIISVSSQNI